MEENFNKRVSRSNLNPANLQDLQGCVYKWQKYNFGSDQDVEFTLMGICEESGELCHAQLKLEQKIRGDSDKHEAEMLDAVGDIMIYAMNYMSGKGWTINPFTKLNGIEKTENQKVIRQAVFAVFRLVGKLVESPDVEDKIHQVIRQVNYLCHLKGWDTENIIRETWSNVGKRDWKRFPETGFAPERDL